MERAEWKARPKSIDRNMSVNPRISSSGLLVTSSKSYLAGAFPLALLLLIVIILNLKIDLLIFVSSRIQWDQKARNIKASKNEEMRCQSFHCSNTVRYTESPD